MANRSKKSLWGGFSLVNDWPCSTGRLVASGGRGATNELTSFCDTDGRLGDKGGFLDDATTYTGGWCRRLA